MNRSALVQGPAKLIFNAPSGAIAFHAQSDFAYQINRRTVPVVTSLHGEIDKREQDISLDLSVKPDGRFDAGLIAALWPYSNSVPGTGLWTDTDRTLVIHAADGAKHTLTAVAVTKMPDLLFSAVATLVGEVGFTGLAANGSSFSTANRLYTIAAGADVVDATFAVAGIKMQPYTATWTGFTGFTGFETQDGFRVSFNLQTEDFEVDTQGVYQKIIKSVGIAVRCVPLGPSSANIDAALKAQGAGAARGRSLDATAAQLQITGADAVNYLTIPNCQIETGSFRFGSSAQQLRVGEVAFVGTRKFTTGAQQALWTLAAS